jgi:uncharacterized cupin superfamily protein
MNLFDVPVVDDADDPEGYRTSYARIGALVGGSKLGLSVYQIRPGQSICPYHYEYVNEEWLVVLEGRPVLRTPGGEEELEPGDVACFPVGPAGAHKVTNRGEATARVLMLSTLQGPLIAVYPDSDKLAVGPRHPDADPRDRLLVRRGESLDYYDGELA